MSIEYLIMAFAILFVDTAYKDRESIDKSDAQAYMWFKVGIFMSVIYIVVFTVLWIRAII